MHPSKFFNSNRLNEQKILQITNDNYKIECLLDDLFIFVNKDSQEVLLDILSRYNIEEIAFCLPQIVNTSLLFNQYFNYSSILIQLASTNQNFALLLFWAYSCYPNDFLEREIQSIKTEIENAVFNGSLDQNSPIKSIYPIFDIEQGQEYIKITREKYFRYQIALVERIVMISKDLNRISEDVQTYLKSFLDSLNLSFSQNLLPGCPYLGQLQRGLVFPFDTSGYFEQIVKVVSEESVCFKTKTKNPYLLVVETIDLNETLPNPRNSTSKFRKSYISKQSECLESSLFANLIETWEQKSLKIQEKSPYRSFTSWRLRGIIVKSGDNLRKEQFAMQIIKKCFSIFKKQNLSIFLYPFNILPTSSDSGLIEYVPDTLSLSSLKEKLPECESLSDLVKTIWRNNYEEALRNFASSLAGYSLVSYMLNLKDRHNENILIDKDCHLIHIDFGFFFCKSPGSINFETAPFKLTQEMVEVLGGFEGDMFILFQSLLISGFIALRKSFNEFYPLIQMMVPGNQLDVYGENENETNRVLIEFSSRFFLELNDGEIIGKVTELIKESANSWKTTWYDKFQKISNNIKN